LLVVLLTLKAFQGRSFALCEAGVGDPKLRKFFWYADEHDGWANVTEQTFHALTEEIKQSSERIARCQRLRLAVLVGFDYTNELIWNVVSTGKHSGHAGEFAKPPRISFSPEDQTMNLREPCPDRLDLRRQRNDTKL